MHHRHVHTGIGTSTLHNRAVIEPVQSRVSSEPIRDDLRTRAHVGTDEAAQLNRGGIRQNGDPCAASDVALPVDALVFGFPAHWPLLDRAHDHRLARRLCATTIALLPPAAIECLINLDQIIQLEIICLGQGMAQLVAEQPRRRISNAKLAADEHGGHATLVMSNQVSSEEPRAERCARLVEDRASRDGVLVAARGALEDAWACIQMVRLDGLALVASKAIRLAQVREGCDAGLFVAVLVAEGQKAGHG
jgi:hypothetical protein